MDSDAGRARLRSEDYLLLAAVVALPWAFGGVELWAYRGAALLIVIAGSVALWRDGWSGLGLAGGPPRWLWPAFLLAVWGGVQLFPMPPAVVRALSPNAAEIQRVAAEALAGPGLAGVERVALARVPEARDVPEPPPRPPVLPEAWRGGPAGWPRLSLQPGATAERLFWYVALLIAFLLARQRAALAGIFPAYRAVLFALFAGLALFGLVQNLTWNGKLYWIRPVLSTSSRPFGPYVAPTHFGGVMELAAPWLAGTAAALFLARRRDDRGGIAVWFVAAAAGLTVVATVAAASKMAAALVLLSLVLLVLTSLDGWRARAWASLGGVVLLAATAWLLSGTQLAERTRSHLQRAGGGRIADERGIAVDAALPMVADYALFGSGFGTFRQVFPTYLPKGEFLRWSQLHNDYLEFLIEGGLIAGGLLLWLVVGYVAKAYRATRHGSAGRIGLALGLTALALHGLVDFNHQIPANALLFVTMAALAVAGARRSANRQAASELDEPA